MPFALQPGCNLRTSPNLATWLSSPYRQGHCCYVGLRRSRGAAGDHVLLALGASTPPKNIVTFFSPLLPRIVKCLAPAAATSV
jgi:hypothetical protein